MRKFTFYWLWLLALLSTANFYGQNAIETLSPNPASSILSVDYKINEGNSAYLMITGINVSNVSNNYIIDINQDNTTIDVSNYPTGVYVINLITDGNISDSKNLIKQ